MDVGDGGGGDGETTVMGGGGVLVWVVEGLMREIVAALGRPPI